MKYSSDLYIPLYHCAPQAINARMHAIRRSSVVPIMPKPALYRTYCPHPIIKKCCACRYHDDKVPPTLWGK